MLMRLKSKANFFRAKVAQNIEQLIFSRPCLSPVESRIFNQMESDGGAVTSLRELSLEFNEDHKTEIAALFADISPAEKGRRKQYAQQASLEQIAAVPVVLLWGLNESLLKIVGAYLRQAPRFRGVVARIDRADGI